MIRYLLAKYLRAEPGFGFITLTKWLAFIGITLGVAVLLVSMAVMNGMNKTFAERLMAMNYPLTLQPLHLYADESKIAERFLPSAFLQSAGAIRRANSLEGAVIFGVDFTREIKINPILRAAIEELAAEQNTSCEQLAQQLNEGFFIIAGSRLAARASAAPGEKIALIFSRLSPAALSSAPTFKRFTLAATFTSGLAAYDASYIFTSLRALQKILRTQHISGIHLASEQPEADATELRRLLAGEFAVIGWWEQNGNILAAMQLEKRALFLILAMLVLIAALNIITSLLMIVLNRRKEIALLLALGACAREVRSAFFALGFAIGAAGTLAGCVLGACCMWVLGHFDLINLPADVYGSAKLPLDLSLLDAAAIVLGSLAISAAAALYPAHKASKIDVLSTLRDE